ncbi:MAG: hypothetical protein KKH51_13205 [Actinobacteria bacterium]|nr:hypothetical protein [Actinomycetota bacterium]
MPADWIEHRRGDRELLGWMRPSGDGFVVVDLLGRELTGEVDWFAAEKTLDDLGIGYLADAYELLLEGGWLRVRLTEVSTECIRVKREDWGDMTSPHTTWEVAFPLPDTLRALGA